MIRRARRRCISNLLLKQGVIAVSVGMAGLILLLLAGTQILDWPWIFALAAAAGAAGLVRLRRRVPSPYLVAQAIDRRMGFHDALSTAWFFDRVAADRAVNVEVRAAQRSAAEELAAGVDLGRAVPFIVPRSLYAMAGLGVIATGLFTLRYAVSHSLDLRPPLARIVFDAFNPPIKQAALENKKKPQRQHLPDMLRQMGLSLDEQHEPAQANGQGTPVSSTEEAKAEKRQQGGTPKPTGISVENKGDKQNQDGTEAGQEGDQNTASLGPPNSDRNSERASSRRENSQNQESNSLMDKFREAMANLLSRLKNGEPKEGQGQQMASSQLGKQGNQGQQGGQKSAQGKGSQKAQGDQNGQSQGEQGDGMRQPQSGAGQQSGSDSDMKSAEQGKSGIGRENGSKELKEAEQLAAMGKISEILGKRAQNLTGEVMVEVASSNQKLKTAYSNSTGERADLGGEIHRDEIPLAYQRYVQQYFEEVRKPGVHGTRKDAKEAKK